MKNTNQIIIAENMGIVAHGLGLACAPHVDVDFMKICDQSKNSINLMKAWVYGWTKANLK